MPLTPEDTRPMPGTSSAAKRMDMPFSVTSRRVRPFAFSTPMSLSLSFRFRAAVRLARTAYSAQAVRFTFPPAV